jgi:hypothetical protein
MNRKVEETGLRFMERMLTSKWGNDYIKNHTPIQKPSITVSGSTQQ